MDVQCREICLKCGGTGKNQLSDSAAFEQAAHERQQFPGGILQPGQYGPPPIERRAKELQVCGYCEKGYNTFWLSLNEALSRGME